jgi:thioredoxin-related protein
MNSRFLTLLSVGLSACCAVPVARGQTPTEVEWRQDYSRARQEATEKVRPLVIDVGTENCFWCKQLDLRTFRDPTVVRVLNEQCIPLKVDASRHATLAEALRVQNYPTLVFATPDGHILGYQEGFIEAPALQEKIQQTLAAMTPPAGDWMTRDLQDASRAMTASEYARAIALLQKIVEDGKDRPAQTQARQMLQELEQQAAGRCIKAKELIEKGEVTKAVEHVVETVRLYAGTRAAREGGQILVTLASRKCDPPAPSGPLIPTASPVPARAVLARDLLSQAREEYGRKQFLACLDRCEAIVAGYADLPEAAEAGKLAAEIKSNPDLTKQACEQMGDRLSLLYLNMAESWLKKGQPQQAVFYLERVVQTFPHSRHAELAQVRLAQIQGAPVHNAEVKK